MTALPLFDCRTCGACCRYEVDVEWYDNGVPEKLVKEDRLLGLVMRIRKGRCIALRGVIGCSVTCSIYEDRPRVCEEFEVGSDMCLEARTRWLPKPNQKEN